MSVSQNINIAYSFDQPLSKIFPSPIISLRSPLTTDKAQLGTVWVNKTINAAWILTSVVSNSASWTDISGAAGSFTTLTVTGNSTLGSATGAVVTIGNDLGATGVVINSGSGGIIMASSVGGVISFSSDSTLEFSAVTSVTIDSTPVVNIGTGGTASATTIGNATGASSLALVTGTGGMSISATGLVSMVPSSATVASPTASSTQNFNVIKTIFTGFTTIATGTQAFTITSNKITATSAIFVSVANLNASGNGAKMSLVSVTQAAGSIVVNTTNNGVGALGGGDNVIISVWIIS